MAHDDRIDRTALTFVVVMTIFILTLAYVIFPRHDAPSGSSPSMSGTSPAAAPQKK
ncbi:MAG TPA: hypothetical protein VJ233_10540 [Hyphomicrobiaceae bacterium]|nr:hypothetical protein [Hyphomicrobiaceae bacterium]